LYEKIDIFDSIHAKSITKDTWNIYTYV